MNYNDDPTLVPGHDNTLIKTVGDVGADPVAMPTHPPTHANVVMPSHGGKVATHTRASTFLVRPRC